MHGSCQNGGEQLPSRAWGREASCTGASPEAGSRGGGSAPEGSARPLGGFGPEERSLAALLWKEEP